jgi:hypothetical protein
LALPGRIADLRPKPESMISKSVFFRLRTIRPRPFTGGHHDRVNPTGRPARPETPAGDRTLGIQAHSAQSQHSGQHRSAKDAPHDASVYFNALATSPPFGGQ